MSHSRTDASVPVPASESRPIWLQLLRWQCWTSGPGPCLTLPPCLAVPARIEVYIVPVLSPRHLDHAWDTLVVTTTKGSTTPRHEVAVAAISATSTEPKRLRRARRIQSKVAREAQAERGKN